MLRPLHKANTGLAPRFNTDYWPCLSNARRKNLYTARPDNPHLAVIAILAACFALSLADALIEKQSASFVLWQIFVMRSVIAIPFLVYLARLQSCAVCLWPRHPGWTLLRSLALVSVWIFYFAALPHVEPATVAAAYYTLPLFITLFAGVFLAEPMRAAGGFALALGFIGTLLILNPRAEGFNAYALLPILAAICYAGAMILTRSKCRQENPVLLSLWLNLCFVAVGALGLLILHQWQPDADRVAVHPSLLGAWTPMWLDEWRIMAILAAAILVGSICAAYAYQNAKASVIAVFDFTHVAFAATWGLLLFAEVPAPMVAGGAVLIVAAGIIAMRQKSSQESVHRRGAGKSREDLSDVGTAEPLDK